MDETMKARVAIAEVRFGLIAPALNGTFPDASMAAYFERVAEEPIEMPDGTQARVRPSTLASWRRRYVEGGFDALVPKDRSDLGTSRRIDEDLASLMLRERAEHPKMGAKLLFERLLADGVVTEGEMSYSTVRRWCKANPVPDAEGPEQKVRRAFEAARVNGIWQADSLHGPRVGKDRRKSYMQAIVDDKSRKLVSARFYEHDDAASFQGTLRAAVASHGIPEKLFVDNGGPYKNAQLSLICGGLGIVLIHAAVRDGAAKGKIERFNRTLRMRFLSVLPESATESLKTLNAALAKWAAEYNATAHSSTGKTPNEAFASEDGQRYFAGDDAALDDAFRNRITRKVAKDSTVRVDHVLYDVPMGLVGERVEIRWTPGRGDDVWVVMPDGSRRRVAPTDKQANAQTKRVRYTIDFTKGGE